MTDHPLFLRPVFLHDGRAGTVVDVHRDGEAFEVEVDSGVITMEANQVTDIAAIAASLTTAQNRVLCRLSGEFEPPPRDISRQSVASLVLRQSALCEREWQDGCAQSTYYRLTPLGQQVRAHLLTPASQDKPGAVEPCAQLR